jgi:hypothetical protein
VHIFKWLSQKEHSQTAHSQNGLQPTIHVLRNHKGGGGEVGSTKCLLLLYLGGGGLRGLMEGSCQMLRFDDKGGDGGQKNPQTRLRSTWMLQ